MARYLTTLQVAAEYPISADTLRKLRARDKLAHGPRFIRRGRSIIYRDVDVDAWLDSHVMAPPPRRGRPRKDKPQV